MKPLDWIGVAFLLFSVAFCALGISRMQSNTEDVLQWLPDKSGAREDYNLFQERFGADDFLIITWDGCTLEDPRLELLADGLRQLDKQSLLQSVTTGGDVMQRLSRQLDLSPSAVRKRMRGIFFGAENPELTCVFMELNEAGTADRNSSMNVLWQAVDSVPGLERSDLAIGGYPYIGTFIGRQLKYSFRACLPPSVLVATLCSFLCLRHFGLTLIVFIVAVGASAVSVAIVPVCGVKFGGLMSIIPALVFVLATSGCVHLIHYALDAIGDPRKLLAIGWQPCTVSAVTTAIGMLSLTRSSFPAIRNFGLFCATGVGAALLFQLFVTPWLLDRFGQPGLIGLAARKQSTTRWKTWLEFVLAKRWPISLGGIGLMVAGAVGITMLKADVEVEKLFREDSEIFRSLAALERNMGPLDQTELMVIYPGAEPDDFVNRADDVRRIQSALARLPEIGVTHSLINYLPTPPRRKSLRSGVERDVYRNVLMRERDRLASSRLLHVDGLQETWRVSLRFPFTREQDFGKLAKEVVEVAAASSQFSSDEPQSVQTVKFIYTGKTHLFNHAQMTLLSDLFSNFLLAFVVITPVLIAVLRSFWLGLIAMIPNLFPVLIVFGGMGWSHKPVDLAIAMTACVALGIAVDDTTHFVVRFCDYGGSLKNLAGPLRQTMRVCGPAMLHTTIIGSAGLFVYYFSDLLVVSKFSWAITVMLIVAVFADLVLLPAILLMFDNRRNSPTQPTFAEKQHHQASA